MTPDPPAPSRVLLVDDLAENLLALTALLRPEGAAIDAARSGREALELLLQRDYAVAVLDVQMPEMDGFELARLMRGAARTRDVPIVFVTAGAVDTARVVEGYDAGAVDFLAKPIDPHVLRCKVRVFLQLDAQRRDLARLAAEREKLLVEAQEALNRLAESEALLDDFFNAAPLGMAFLDRRLRFRRVNRALAEMNGFAVEEHLGKRPRDLLPELVSERLEADFRRVLESGEPLLDVPVEGSTPGTGGEPRSWSEIFYPVKLGQLVIGLAILARDVTPEKRSAELQRFLFGIVGHDLRNPLAVLASSIHLLDLDGELSDRSRRATRRMRTAVDRMERIIRDLLDYTRVHGGARLPIDRSPCDLAELARAAADEATGAAPGREVRLEAEGDLRGEWDPERLRQVLGNLVGNAFKHGVPGAPVALRLRGGGADEVEVEVENAGAPIPAAALERIFEPLVQGESGRERGGIGLGLFIARQIVRAHGGAMAVRSDARATAFSFRLPRRAPAAAGG